MTNEQTLELLKPIMLDGAEQVGDSVFSIINLWGTIHEINEGAFSLSVDFTKNNKGVIMFTKEGKYNQDDVLPTLFKSDPFNYLFELNKTQERVIQVFNEASGKWMNRVLIKVVDGNAVCWNGVSNINDSSVITETFVWKKWRELPQTRSIAKDEALKILGKLGVDTTNLTIE